MGLARRAGRALAPEAASAITETSGREVETPRAGPWSVTSVWVMSTSRSVLANEGFILGAEWMTGCGDAMCSTGAGAGRKSCNLPNSSPFFKKKEKDV